MRAQDEPTVKEEKSRSGRAQNEPPAGDHPLDLSPTGSQMAASRSRPPCAMVKMLRAERPRARPSEPWWHPPYHTPPAGSSGRWLIVENFVVRVHCKFRYQRCHPIHSSYPLRDEQVLTGRRVTIKYIAGEQPGRPSTTKSRAAGLATPSWSSEILPEMLRWQATMWVNAELVSGLEGRKRCHHISMCPRT